jgi:LmbE family N-acetylglucosaminyl deacetylase
MDEGMQTIAALGNVMVISPHLDDGVFSCGELLAAARAKSVLTVFAGMPDAYHALPEWDAAAGFDSARQAITARRDEDRNALDLLQATPLWLDFCDSQYGAIPDERTVAAALADALRQHCPDSVMVPAGLFHSDHELAHRAALLVRQDDPERNWFVYEDALYRRIAGLLQRRLALLMDAGICATPVAFDTAACVQTKRHAVACYASQLRALATAGRPGQHDLPTPERYWRLTRIAPAR